MSRCDAELCPNWSGDGDVCPCAVFGLTRPVDEAFAALGVNRSQPEYWTLPHLFSDDTVWPGCCRVCGGVRADELHELSAVEGGDPTP